MERILPVTGRSRGTFNILSSSRLVLFLLCATFADAFSQNVDLTLTNLTVTAVDETNFTYSFDLTNNGTSDVQGYNMRLTFSANESIDGADYFKIIVPLNINAGQFIGGSQTLAKTEHYYGLVPEEYLPSGTWNVIATINYDSTLTETNYNNNTVVSTNALVVAPYQIELSSPPSISDITDNSFIIHATFDPRISRIYYKVQLEGTPAPGAAAIKASKGLFPFENDNLVNGLGPAYTYDVYSVAEAYDGNTSAIYITQATTTGAVTPTISTSIADLKLQTTAIGEESPGDFFKLSAFHLSGNVVITPSAGFEVSRDDITYANQVSFLPSEFQPDVPVFVFVKSLPKTDAVITSGVVTCTTQGAGSSEVTVTISVFDPLNGSFEGLSALNETGWRSFNVSGAQIWSLVDLDESSPNQRVAGENMAVQIDGATNGVVSNEDWLISPRLDVNAFLYHPTIRFKTYTSGPGEKLVLKYSANYSGIGDPRNAQWVDADVDFPAVDSEVWKESFLELPIQEGNLHFAFVYTSTTTAASRWSVDDWRVTDNLLTVPSEILTFNDIELGTSSESQSFFLEIAGYGDMTITASESYQISKDNITFSSSFSVPGNSGISSQVIYIRFTPVTLVTDLAGSLTFTASDLSVSRQLMIGTSLSVTATERVVRTSGFVYPNPTSGPVRVDMDNFENLSNTVPVWVANGIGATVASFESSVTSLETQLSDVVVDLAPGVYFVTIRVGDVTYRNKVLKR